MQGGCCFLVVGAWRGGILKARGKPRNGGKWSEAAYWGAVRSALRSKMRYWVPAMQAKQAARRVNESDNPRLKWEFRCAGCGGWFADKEVQVDHVVPCGSLRCAGDIDGFLARLTPEDPAAFQVLCKACHNEKTQAERKNKCAPSLEFMLDIPAGQVLMRACGHLK